MTDANAKRNNHVKSVLKAFHIIEALDRRGELSIGELSEILEMDKATVHRLVNTVKEAGYVTQDSHTKRYSNSIKLFMIGNKIVERTGLIEIGHPHVVRLAEKTNETVNLGLYAGEEIVYVDKMESDSPIKAGIQIGTPIPLYCTGMGKAVLAFMPQKQIDEILMNTEFTPRTANTVTSKEQLLGKLERIRQRGYSKDEEEYVEGLISFGAPIFDYHRSPIAAISVSMPKMRYDADTQKDYYAELIIRTASQISKDLGYKK